MTDRYAVNLAGSLLCTVVGILLGIRAWRAAAAEEAS